MNPSNASRLADMAVAIALAAILSLLKLKLPHLIYGGSVSLHALPLFILARRRGVRAGVWAGCAYGVVNFLLTPYFVHPVQVVLDYPAAFAVLGLAGLRPAQRSGPAWAAIAVVCASLLRFLLHVLSGVVYFADLAPAGTPVWQYSVVYNASYMIPETAIAAVATALLVRRLRLS